MASAEKHSTLLILIFIRRVNNKQLDIICKFYVHTVSLRESFFILGSFSLVIIIKNQHLLQFKLENKNAGISDANI